MLANGEDIGEIMFSQNEAFRKIYEDILGEQVYSSCLSNLAPNERDAVTDYSIVGLSLHCAHYI